MIIKAICFDSLVVGVIESICVQGSAIRLLVRKHEARRDKRLRTFDISNSMECVESISIESLASFKPYDSRGPHGQKYIILQGSVYF